MSKNKLDNNLLDDILGGGQPDPPTPARRRPEKRKRSTVKVEREQSSSQERKKSRTQKVKDGAQDSKQQVTIYLPPDMVDQLDMMTIRLKRALPDVGMSRTVLVQAAIARLFDEYEQDGVSGAFVDYV